MTNLTQHVKVKTSEGSKDGEASKGKEGAEQDLVEYMPKFLWVVRDFTL